MQDNKVVILGYSGHAYVVLEAALMQGINVNQYSDFTQNRENPFLLEYLGNENDKGFIWDDKNDYILGIGNNDIRYRVAKLVEINKGKLVNIIHPKAWLSERCVLGKGNFINANSSVNAFANIGSYCILNTGCIVEHECIVGDAVHIGPGAVLAGGVSVGDFSFIGANAVVKQGLRIGKNVVIGAGSVVLKDVPDGEIIVGNPARKIK